MNTPSRRSFLKLAGAAAAIPVLGLSGKATAAPVGTTTHDLGRATITVKARTELEIEAWGERGAFPVRQFMSMVGHVNSTPFWDFPAGTVLFSDMRWNQDSHEGQPNDGWCKHVIPDRLAVYRFVQRPEGWNGSIRDANTLSLIYPSADLNRLYPTGDIPDEIKVTARGYAYTGPDCTATLLGSTSQSYRVTNGHGEPIPIA